MAEGKIEPRLESELSTTSEGAVLPVLIELAHPVEAGAKGADDLARRVREGQRDLLSRLSELDAGDPRPLTLANAVSVDLRAGHVREIAARDDVRVVRLAREEQVTT